MTHDNSLTIAGIAQGVRALQWLQTGKKHGKGRLRRQWLMLDAVERLKILGLYRRLQVREINERLREKGQKMMVSGTDTEKPVDSFNYVIWVGAQTYVSELVGTPTERGFVRVSGLNRAKRIWTQTYAKSVIKEWGLTGAEIMTTAREAVID